MRKLKARKKGELTSSQLALLILAVMSFLVLLGFWYMLNIEHEMNSWWCHFSVVLRATLNKIGGGALELGQYIELACRTEKVCVQEGGEGCGGIIGTKDNPIQNEKVDDKRDVMNVMAEKLYECNSVLGEGKINFMPSQTFKQNYCLICSRIAFDDKVKGDIKQIGVGELYQYMEEEKKNRRGDSYLSVIYPGWSSWKDYEEHFAEMKNKDDAMQEESERKLTGIDNPEQWIYDLEHDETGYAVVFQMQKKGKFLSMSASALSAIGVVIAIPFAASGVGLPIGLGIIGASLQAGALVGGGVYWYSNPNGEFEYAPPVILPYNAGILDGLKCTEFNTAF
ncbi:MAG: hypothetical protein ABIE22_04515 [archaeon]